MSAGCTLNFWGYLQSEEDGVQKNIWTFIWTSYVEAPTRSPMLDPLLFSLSLHFAALPFTRGALSHARIVIHRAHHHFADSDLEGTLSICWKIPNLYFTLVQWRK